MQKAARLTSIDMLRGLVIVLMALDHTRDFFGAALFDPEDLAKTTPLWFATRWITHLCASTFVLLAGTSAFLRGTKSGIPSLSRYLVTRGLLLLVLEATWISFSWQFGYNVTILQVLWALGMGMIFLAGLAWLPTPAIAAIAALLIVPHNLLDTIQASHPLWLAWHQRGFWPVAGNYGVYLAYPLMPWLGLIAAGYALGPVFQWEPARRQRFLVIAGAVLLLAFVVLRSGNFYGDPDPWSPQGRGFVWDFISFIRVHKYPPSLLYLCVTVGIALPVLAWFERLRPIPLLMLFGGTPMFFYVIHIAMIHFLSGPYFLLRFGALPQGGPGGFILPPGYEPSLGVVYAAWLMVIAIMYGLTMLWLRRRSVRPMPAAAGQ
ncbi:MAG TPA: heparan-alpha-glucosaminide N-acetyltransferase domain-containing protein [Pseudoduganella sp.]